MQLGLGGGVGGGFDVSVGPLGVVVLGVLAGLGAFAVAEHFEPKIGPGSPACCPRPVPQILPADICPQVLGAACCA